MKKDALQKEIQKHVAMWVSRNSNNASLITIVSLDLSDDISHARVGVSVLPETHEKDALRFLTKHVIDIKMYLKKHTRGMLPHTYGWFIDLGTKNREKIYEILANDKRS